MIKKPTPKTQVEISKSLPEPYIPERGNPNTILENKDNRAKQTSIKADDVKDYTVTLQDHDEAVLYYLKEIVKPSIIQNGEKIDVPIMFASPEKWKSYQEDGYLRDLKGSVMAPLILFKRDSINKIRSIANKLDANHPYNYIISPKYYSNRNSYSSFNILNNKKPVKEFYAVVAPDYITLKYSFTLYTYYIEQQNDVVEALQYASDSYWGNPEKFKFKTSIGQFTFQTDLTVNSERIIKSTFEITLNGYIIPQVRQKTLNAIRKFSPSSKISFNLETTSDNLE